MLSDVDTGHALVELVEIYNAGSPGGCKVALVSVIRSLFVFQAGSKFRHQEVEVAPPLAVRVAALVDQHAVYHGAQVSAMVKVETPKVVLVGLSFSAVLAHDQARHGFQQFSGAVNSARFQLLLRDHARLGESAIPNWLVRELSITTVGNDLSCACADPPTSISNRLASKVAIGVTRNF